jgi:hypothetical protein
VHYRQLLESANGYVAFHGGLHVRGACLAPEWHSLRSAWFGEDAISHLFTEVEPTDVPFAQDALGDQFVLRDGFVWALSAETGLLSPKNMTLLEFDAAVREDPDEFLQLGPLQEFRAAGGVLAPGQLLSAVPPFVFRESADGVSYRAISAKDRLHFLADLAKEIRNLPDGAKLTFKSGQ